LEQKSGLRIRDAMRTNNYQIVADLLEYPTSVWPERLESGGSAFSDQAPSIAQAFARFRDEATLPLAELQELYTRTFDLNPVCALEIGYHLFGENYKRGIFLANLRATEAPFALGQEEELPDYLPVLLRLLPCLEDDELSSALVHECLVPALKKMLAPLQERANLYRHLLELLIDLFGTKEDAPRAQIQRRQLVILSNIERGNECEVNTSSFGP
jgi:nitrate reductase delta subunit